MIFPRKWQFWNSSEFSLILGSGDFVKVIQGNSRSFRVIYVSINEKQTEDGEWYCQENDKTVKSYRLYVDGKLI